MKKSILVSAALIGLVGAPALADKQAKGPEHKGMCDGAKCGMQEKCEKSGGKWKMMDKSEGNACGANGCGANGCGAMDTKPAQEQVKKQDKKQDKKQERAQEHKQ